MEASVGLQSLQPKMRTLEELHETAGLRETVLDFLTFHEVACLRRTSKRILKAVTAENGTLLAVNRSCTAFCRASEDKQELIASIDDLSPVHAYADISRLKRLRVHVVIPDGNGHMLVRIPIEPGTITNAAEVSVPLNLDNILAPLLQSLLGHELISFIFLVQVPRMWYTPSCYADKGLMTRFATSLARLVALEELCVSSTVALHEINALGCASTSMLLPNLRRLQLYGASRLHDMTPQSLAFQLLAPSAGAGIVPQDGASSRNSEHLYSQEARRGRAVEHFSCILDADALRQLEDDGSSSSSGRKFWSAVVTPRLTSLEISAEFRRSGEEDVSNELLWERDWVWRGTGGVTKLSLQEIPLRDCKERFPHLRVLLLSVGPGAVYNKSRPRCRSRFKEFVNGFTAKWIRLSEFYLSTMEAGFLLGRLADNDFWPQIDPDCRRALSTQLEKECECEHSYGSSIVDLTVNTNLSDVYIRNMMSYQ